MKKTIHFKAQINYFTTSKGGLVTPISDGYRSEIKFPFENKSFIAAQTFTETELIFPGDAAIINIALIGAEQFLHKPYNGMNFELADSLSIISDGTITEVY